MSHLRRITWAIKPWRKTLLVALISILALLVAGFLLVWALGGPQRVAVWLGQVQEVGLLLRGWVEQTGALAPLTYVLAKALVFMTIPVVGYPLNVASGALFGLVGGVLLTAAGDTLGACILFLLSRRAGRGLVSRLVGEGRMQLVDRVLDRGLGGWRELLFFRVVMPIPFNFVSLAAGLAHRLPLWQFAVVTFITASPKVFTVGLGSGLVTGEWVEVAVAIGLFVVAVAALFTSRRIRKDLVKALRWRRDEEIKEGLRDGS